MLTAARPSPAACSGGITRNTCMHQYTGKLASLVVKNFTTSNTTDGSPECCAACAADPRCTFWMWNHGDRDAKYHPATCFLTSDTKPKPTAPPRATP